MNKYQATLNVIEEWTETFKMSFVPRLADDFIKFVKQKNECAKPVFDKPCHSCGFEANDKGQTCCSHCGKQL